MAKQPYSGDPDKQVTSAESNLFPDRHQYIADVTEVVKAVLSVLQQAPVVAGDRPKIVVELINGKTGEVSVPDLPNLGDLANDKRLEALAAIVRLSDAHAPAFYRLDRVFPNDMQQKTESRQVTAS